VVNAAIELRAEVEIEPAPGGYRLESEDLQEVLHLSGPEELGANGRLDLLKAALRRYPIPGGTLRTRCAAPAGSGLGSSGALDVALVAALDAARGVARSGAEMAQEAFLLESVEAGLPGGRQDQYAAALGGFHRFGFSANGVSIDPLPLPSGFADELARRIIVCYTGVSRVSSRAIERVVGAYQRRDAGVTGALREMVRVAELVADAMRRGDIDRIGPLLAENWLLQQRLDPGMRTAEMAALEASLVRAGAAGGKAAGAGAGGSMFFLVRDAEAASAAARQAGATVLPVRWAPEGVRVC
jgi:D-glycero-alpha-D-manno-heptose-7-phosphate kinase